MSGERPGDNGPACAYCGKHYDFANRPVKIENCCHDCLPAGDYSGEDVVRGLRGWARKVREEHFLTAAEVMERAADMLTPAAPVSPVEGERRDEAMARLSLADERMTAATAAFDRLGEPIDKDAQAEWLTAIGLLRVSVQQVLAAAPVPLPVDSEERPDTAALREAAFNAEVGGIVDEEIIREAADWIDAHRAASAAPGGQDGRVLERVQQAYTEALRRAMRGDLQYETRVLYDLLSEFDALPAAPEVPRPDQEGGA